MHPNIMEIIEHRKKKKIKVNVITNFTLIDEEIAKKLVNLKVDLLTASIWAATPSTYTKLHPNQVPDTFVHIKNTLKQFYILKQKKDCVYPHIRIYNVICKLNYHHLGIFQDNAIRKN